jgi:hypothetical protein
MVQGGLMLQKSAKWAKPTKSCFLSRENRAPTLADFLSRFQKTAGEIGHWSSSKASQVAGRHP